ncbi:uncharacterized protein LOC131163529 [Malania oleifera]|uniref:uncharacterized protein LOC131163529 n=1 Tax=Malania oleifera TaxID=397392 RepID=UPI0025AE5D3F|nr:uncharacterized protein LOC131163529 [Malania oleifera]
MPRQIVLRPPSMNRRQPLLTNQSSTGSARFAEVAGGTTAECAAICCCCPCGLVNLLVLAVYKVPAELCRKALRKKRRRRLIKKGVLPQRRCCVDPELHNHSPPHAAAEKAGKMDESEKEAMDLEKEMWDRFYNTGFWRSPSQREQQNGK